MSSRLLPPRPPKRWEFLRKAWSLHRRGQDHLSEKKIASASDLLYKADPLQGLLDWLWRFVLFIGQPDYEHRFRAALEAIRPLMQTPNFMELAAYYSAMAEDRGERYFEMMKEYFEAFADFGQVHFHVARGMDVPEGNVISSVDFDATRMFYGNSFEAFASSVDILAYLNNIRAGRPFGQFERLTKKEYLRLDKANRFEAFTAMPDFGALCEERDNQLRNASHHGGMRMERRTQTVRYRAGKGGIGQEHRMGYATYLARSVRMFLQAMTLLRIEIMMCHSSGMRPPL